MFYNFGLFPFLPCWIPLSYLLLFLFLPVQTNTENPLESIYAITDSSLISLRELIESKTNYSNQVIQKIIYQILKTLYFLHSAGVCHGSIELEALFVNQYFDVTLSSFCKTQPLGSYVEVEGMQWDKRRNYYFPDQYCFFPWEIKVSEKHDLWGLGCLMAQLWKRDALFLRPRASSLGSFEQMLKVIGSPTSEELAQLNEKHVGRLDRHYDRVCWEKILPDASAEGCDLLDQLLQFDPAKRISVDQALRHPYFRPIFQEKELISSFTTFTWQLPLGASLSELQELVWRELNSFRSKELWER